MLSRKLSCQGSTFRQCIRHFSNLEQVIQRMHAQPIVLGPTADMCSEGDRVVLRCRDATKEPVFTGPVKSGNKTETRWGIVKHEQLLGKRSRELVQTHKGETLLVKLPTLEEYVVLTPRMVTPVRS